jgi:glutamate/tyrosine decarboxylase-like PLP-dependent enzyme
VHVYQVSPALTVIEKETGRALAARFGLDGPHAGGITQPGGSAANQTSMVIARNHLFPDTKTHGNGARRLVLFTSAHGHYSVEKAAQMFGLGTQAVRAIAVDARGRMQPAALDRAIVEARAAGETPFYVNATAGTTVLGSFDPVDRIADVARRHGLWLHVDASWGGSVVFSDAQKGKLRGADRADSISICPHKMLNVPLTCSFLLGRDLRTFHRGMTLPAGYLFHGDNPEDDDDDDDDDDEEEEKNDDDDENPSSSSSSSSSSTTAQFWDLADLTPQCGRRGDSLKLALVWLHHGRAGLGSQIDAAFAAAALLADLLVRDPAHFTLVSAEVPPPCLQVCFYYRKRDPEGDGDGAKAAARRNGVVTRRVCRALVARGFMVDYAPGVEGLFLRVVVNGFTEEGTVRGLVGAVREVGEELGL